jgi:simple sugar transport system substrate-binding protein
MGSTQLGKRGAIGKPLLAAAAVVATSIALAACSGGGSNGGSHTSSPATSGSSATVSSGGGGGLAVYVVGGKSDDPFWSKVKRGAEDAGKAVAANGGSVHWLGPQNYDNLGPDAAKLLRTALSAHAAAVVGADWVPEAEDAAFKQITSSGIPVVVYNSGGIEAANNVGALSYVGTDESLAGKTAGQYMATHGVKNVMCVNTLPGAANTEARCKGIGDGESSGGGKMKELPLPSSNFGNPTAVAQAIKAALLKDSSIDGVVTISTQDADSAASALSQANLTSKVQLATFDIDSTQLQRIQAGTQMLAIDQQPYMQGYLAVSLAYQFAKFGLELPQKPILTGPALITKDNVAAVIAGAKAGVR